MAVRILSNDNQEPRFPINLPGWTNIKLEHLRARLCQITPDRIFTYGDLPAPQGQRLWVDCGERPPQEETELTRGIPPIKDTTMGHMSALQRVILRIESPISLRKVDDTTFEMAVPPQMDLKAEIDKLAVNMVRARGPIQL